MIGFDGSMNTGLTLRTVRIKNGVAEVRAGATLLYDSSPVAEELETELKASAMIDAITQSGSEDAPELEVVPAVKPEQVGDGKRVILIDHEDSFVHTLGNYLRQTGAEVQTLRSGKTALAAIEQMIRDGNKPDMVVLSPGPGNPSDFGLSTTIEFLIKRRIPAFGVCLGLQGMVEHFGGTLGVLSYPMHGKPSHISLRAPGQRDDSIFAGLPDSFEVARYHSLHGIREHLPSSLEVTATSEDGVVMGIQHKTLPFAAVQFHPESILTSPVHGLQILKNALRYLRYKNDGEESAPTGSEIVAELEKLSIKELQEKLKAAGLVSLGSKSELVVRLALWRHKSDEAKAGRLALNDLSVPELTELKQSLGLKVSAPSKAELLEGLESCLKGS
jgi:anthranilate synthase